MWKRFENRKQLIAKCYLIILSVSALLFTTLVYKLTVDFTESEMLMFWGKTPWTLTPMLICSVIAAFFTDKGCGKMVGIISLFVFLTSAVIVSGSMVWMASEYRRSGIEWIQLYGYQIRMPVALFLFADSFMRGGAVGLLLSNISQTRMSKKDSGRDIRYMSLSTIICIVFASAWLLIDPQLSWPAIALGGALLVLLAIPAFFCYKSLDYSLVGESEPNNDKALEKRNWLLHILVFSLCMTIIYSFWKYIPYTWHFYSFGFYGFSLTILPVAFAIAMLFLAKRPCNNSVLTGSIILLFAVPLCALGFDILPFDLILAILMGIGLAMIVLPTIGSIIRIPVRLYSLTWVGIAVGIKVTTCNLMFRAFDCMEHTFNTTTIAVYIIYPLLVIVLMVLGYYLSSQKTEIVSNE